MILTVCAKRWLAASEVFIERHQMDNGDGGVTQMEEFKKNILPQTEHLLIVAHDKLIFLTDRFLTQTWCHF